jgi:hypothetical protein
MQLLCSLDLTLLQHVSGSIGHLQVFHFLPELLPAFTIRHAFFPCTTGRTPYADRMNNIYILEHTSGIHNQATSIETKWTGVIHCWLISERRTEKC